MALDYRNINSLWASVVVETLSQLGVSLVAICPGSRSSPLAVAFAQYSQIAAVPILDERSAAFFALGHGKRTGQPAVVVCTSGTAAANFYPAVIEARESRVPLLILTADRPPELRDCRSGQTIDQLKLYGNYPNWQTELAVPQLDLLPYLQQTIIYAWERTLLPQGGAVQVNCPFRDPLAPIADLAFTDLQVNLPPVLPSSISQFMIDDTLPIAWQTSRGLIVAGVAQPPDPTAYAAAVHHLATVLGWPILAEALSPLRNYDSNRLVSTYDAILRQPNLAQELRPDVVIQLGDLPTSKELRQWLSHLRPPTWIVESSTHNHNALQLPATHWRSSLSALVNALGDQAAAPSPYLDRWRILEQQTRAAIDRAMANIHQLSEVKIPWLLSQLLPTETLVWVANSMPIRDMEFFWQPNNRRYRILGNRGANGIDGTLSAAIGALHLADQPGLLITGDLSFLHDTNGLLLRQQFRGRLKILLINNNGGGIFAMLPIAAFDPPFREFFTTPQNVEIAQLCAAYQISYRSIQDWAELELTLEKIMMPGLEVWEMKTNFQQDSAWRKENLGHFAIE